MITNYELFKIYESINISNDDIVEILKNLEDENNKNANLINRLVNITDKSGKNVLMNIVEKGNVDLVDYVLKFNPDIHQVTKDNRNILFFCRSLKMFKKFYDLNVNVNIKTNKNINILTELSSKKIFNVELYQQLIDDGVNINEVDIYNRSVLTNSILNIKIITLLIKNNINLNISIKNQNFLNRLLHEYKYYPKKRVTVLKILKILLSNGLKIYDTSGFISTIIDLSYYVSEIDDLEFIKELKDYLDDDFIIEYWKKKNTKDSYKIALTLLNMGTYPKFYMFLKSLYKDKFYMYFKDYIKENPEIEVASKYNL